ncbi:DUF2690 domain-containing protein [Streptomyces sp. NPDC060322]|uniref:DUF2690 domain-containing protein n=1 Tax=unclassified Streptomyces TaxID=2593676 RepID=UPI0036518197
MSALATSVVMLTATQVAAAPYDPYTGTNPYTTGCDVGAVTIGTRQIRSPQAVYGTMEVRYSPTCQTNWVRAVMTVSNTSTTITKGIQRMSSQPDGQGGWLGYYQNYDYDPGTGSSFGMQVFAPGSTCISAMAVLRDSSGQAIASTGTNATNAWVVFC